MNLLNQNGYDEKELTPLKSSEPINDKYANTDKSASHIAEMLIIGSNMG